MPGTHRLAVLMRAMPMKGQLTWICNHYKSCQVPETYIELVSACVLPQQSFLFPVGSPQLGDTKNAAPRDHKTLFGHGSHGGCCFRTTQTRPGTLNLQNRPDRDIRDDFAPEMPLGCR